MFFPPKTDCRISKAVWNINIAFNISQRHDAPPPQCTSQSNSLTHLVYCNWLADVIHIKQIKPIVQESVWVFGVLVSKMLTKGRGKETKQNQTEMSERDRGITMRSLRGNRNSPRWETHRAKRTACFISCSAFLNSLFTTQAWRCKESKARNHCVNEAYRLVYSNWHSSMTHGTIRLCLKIYISFFMYLRRPVSKSTLTVIEREKESTHTLEACLRTSTTTLTGKPAVISFIASMHHR